MLYKNIDYLSRLTKEEADLIEDAIKWNGEQKVSFLLANKIFEEEMNADK